jgi:hypothetical protein
MFGDLSVRLECFHCHRLRGFAITKAEIDVIRLPERRPARGTWSVVRGGGQNRLGQRAVAPHDMPPTEGHPQPRYH